MDARIKATYAVIYDADMKPLYSLQARDFGGRPVFDYDPKSGVYHVQNKKSGILKVMLLPEAIERISATSNVQLPDVVYVKACAVTKNTNTRKWLTIAAVATGLFVLLKRKK